MPGLSDPVVAGLLAEFNDAVLYLQQTSLSDAARQRIIEQLCELSRDARFQIGPPEYADETQLKDMAQCFHTGAQRILGLWPAESIPDSVRVYCQNIQQRADRCLGRPVAVY